MLDRRCIEQGITIIIVHLGENFSYQISITKDSD
jgi:hypothetical protein